MCFLCDRLDAGAPYRISLGNRLQGHHITHRAHAMTGELVPVERWVNQIHGDDWDWYERHWAWMDEFEFRLMVAGVSDGRAA